MGPQRDYDISFFIPALVVCSIGIVANLMLLVAFIKDPLKCFRNSATYLVGNLALSDFVHNIMFTSIISFGYYPNGIVEFLQYLSFYSSISTIFSISLDRYLMIAYPFKHRFLMSGKKMAVWIAFIWLLSSIHPMRRLFVSKNVVDVIKPVVGTSLIALTAIAYGKTYFALKKQAKSMLGKKAPFTSLKGQSTSNIDKDDSRSTTEDFRKSCSIETQNSLVKIEHEQSENLNLAQIDHHVQNGHVCASFIGECDQSLDERAQNIDNFVQTTHVCEIQCELDESSDGRSRSHQNRVQNLNDCAESQSERGGLALDKSSEDADNDIQNRNERVKGKRYQIFNEHALDNRVQNVNIRGEVNHSLDVSGKNHDKCPVAKKKCAQVTNDRAQKGDDCSKSSKDSTVINNANEQKFLNTVLIVACVAVVTIASGTVYAQMLQMVQARNPKLHNILHPLSLALLSINFAVNPFIYYLRLKRYKKTFEIVYRCKY